MSTLTYAIYKESNTGKKYRMYPTLVWFDKNTELVSGEEKICSIIFSELRRFLKNVEKRDFDEPLQGSIDITKKNDFFVIPHVTHVIQYNLYNYQLSFDEVECLDLD